MILEGVYACDRSGADGDNYYSWRTFEQSVPQLAEAATVAARRAGR